MTIIRVRTWPLSKIPGIQRFGYRIEYGPEDGDDGASDAPTETASNMIGEVET